MIDFHAHILPRFDDGARNTDAALAMLKAAAESGVEVMLSTSHCYPVSDADIEKFTDRRARRIFEVTKKAEENGINIPRIIPAAEVNLCSDLAALDGTDALCIDGTNYILVEMPWDTWTEEHIDRVYNLILRGFRPVMAHIERFLYQKEELLEELFSMRVLYQINTASLYSFSARRTVLKLMRRGLVHVLGSDTHNLDKRPPDLCRGFAAAEKYFSEGHRRLLEENAQKIIQNEEVDKDAFKRLDKVSSLKLL